MKIKEDFICPKCKHKNRMKLYSTVTGDDIKKVIDKSIFLTECKNCHERISTLYPLEVQGSNYMIYFTPSKNDEIDDTPSKFNRVCDTYADLKEKILIFEDHLNDIVIEELKSQIKSNLLISNLELDLSKLEEIRYNSSDLSYLNFSLIGIGELVGISLSEYQNLERGIKMKKIKKSVLIDEYTYKKYIRTCHYEINGKKRIGFFKW